MCIWKNNKNMDEMPQDSRNTAAMMHLQMHHFIIPQFDSSQELHRFGIGSCFWPLMRRRIQIHKITTFHVGSLRDPKQLLTSINVVHQVNWDRCRLYHGWLHLRGGSEGNALRRKKGIFLCQTNLVYFLLRLVRQKQIKTLDSCRHVSHLLVPCRNTKHATGNDFTLKV